MDIGYIRKRFAQSTVEYYPFPHIFIENFLSDKDYATLKNDFESIDWEEIKRHQSVNYHDPEAFAEFERSGKEIYHNYDSSSVRHVESMNSQIEDFFTSEAFFNEICNAFGIENFWDNVTKTGASYYLDLPDHFIPIHRDSRKSELPVIQGQIFMSDEDYDCWGTILYTDKTGSEFIEMPMKHNSILVYGIDPDNSWHGTRPGNRIRKSLLFRFRTNKK